MQSDVLFETLADPSRRLILTTLLHGECAVGDLVAAVDIDPSGVSRHLRILSEAGFVKMRPDGPHRLYSLRAEPFRELDAWVSRYRKLWEVRLDRSGAEVTRRRKARAEAKNEKKARR